MKNSINENPEIDRRLDKYVNLFIYFISAYFFFLWALFLGTSEFEFDALDVTFSVFGVAATVGAMYWLRRLPAEWKTNVSLLTFSLLASVYVIEVFLTLPINLSGFVKKFTDTQDNRSGVAVVQDWRKQNIDAYVSMFHVPVKLPHVEKEVFVHGQISKTKIVLCKEGEGWISIDTDRHGFRNDDQIWDEPKLDVVAVGDSYTHGHCLEWGIVERIKEKYPLTLNLGRSSSGALEYLARLVEYLPEVSPKMVLWFHLESNDIPVVVQRTDIAYLDDDYSLDLVNYQKEIDQQLKELHEKKFFNWTEKKHTAARIKNVTKHYKASEFFLLKKTIGKIKFIITNNPNSIDGLLPPKPVEEDLERLERILSKADKLSKKVGAKLVFVYLPHEGTLRIGEGNGRTLAIRESVISVAEKVGLPVVDLTAELMNKGPSRIYDRPGWHPNAEGAQAIADYVIGNTYSIMGND